MRAAVAVLACAAASRGAAAERAIHGSVAAGGALLLTGERGDRGRLDATLELEPRSRFGGLVAWRAFDAEHRGLVVAGVVFEAAAARPRVVIGLHAGAGADLDARAPLAGAGVRTTLAIYGPVGLVLDSGAYLVIDGLSDTRLQLQGDALLAVRW